MKKIIFRFSLGTRKNVLLFLTLAVFLPCLLLNSNHVQGQENLKASPVFNTFSYKGDDKIYKENPLKPNEFYTPILQGCYPDPSITRKGDDYYLVSSSFAFFPGVPIFHSTDLVNWKQIGHVLDRPSQLKVSNSGISAGI